MKGIIVKIRWYSEICYLGWKFTILIYTKKLMGVHFVTSRVTTLLSQVLERKHRPNPIYITIRLETDARKSPAKILQLRPIQFLMKFIDSKFVILRLLRFFACGTFFVET